MSVLMSTGSVKKGNTYLRYPKEIQNNPVPDKIGRVLNRKAR